MSNAFNDPSHAKLIKIWREMDVPGFVKEAASVDEQDFSGVDVDHFADPANRLYPINTKSNTWLSREHFGRDKEKLEKHAAEFIEKRLTKAASFWNLDQPIRFREDGGEPTVHHITIDGDHDTEKVVMDVSGHYKQAAEDFISARSSYSYDTCRDVARQLLGAPEDVKEPLEVDTEQTLCKMASYGSCMPNTARNAIFMRMCLVRKTDPATFGQLTKMAKVVSEHEGLMNIDLLHKVARVLDAVDRTKGFHVRYGQALNPPEELFHFTEKRASAVRDEAMVLDDGTILNRHEVLDHKGQVQEYFEKIAGVTYEDDEEMLTALLALHATEIPTLMNFLEA